MQDKLTHPLLSPFDKGFVNEIISGSEFLPGTPTLQNEFYFLKKEPGMTMQSGMSVPVLVFRLVSTEPIKRQVGTNCGQLQKTWMPAFV